MSTVAQTLNSFERSSEICQRESTEKREREREMCRPAWLCNRADNCDDTMVVGMRAREKSVASHVYKDFTNTNVPYARLDIASLVIYSFIDDINTCKSYAQSFNRRFRLHFRIRLWEKYE